MEWALPLWNGWWLRTHKMAPVDSFSHWARDTCRPPWHLFSQCLVSFFSLPTMFSFFIFVHSTAADVAEATEPLKITTCPVPAGADTERVVTQWWHKTHELKQIHYPADQGSVLTTLDSGQFYLKLSVFSKINLAQPIRLRLMHEEDKKLIFVV